MILIKEQEIIKQIMGFCFKKLGTPKEIQRFLARFFKKYKIPKKKNKKQIMGICFKRLGRTFLKKEDKKGHFCASISFIYLCFI